MTQFDTRFNIRFLKLLERCSNYQAQIDLADFVHLALCDTADRVHGSARIGRSSRSQDKLENVCLTNDFDDPLKGSTQSEGGGGGGGGGGGYTSPAAKDDLVVKLPITKKCGSGSPRREVEVGDASSLKRALTPYLFDHFTRKGAARLRESPTARICSKTRRPEM